MFHIESRDKVTIRWKIVGVLLVAVCFLFTALLWWMLNTTNASMAQSRFDAQVDNTVDMLEKRVEAYTDSLYGLRALFLVHPDTTKEEWDGFVLTQSYAERFPGLENLAYVDRAGVGQGAVVYVSNPDMNSFVGTEAGALAVHKDALIQAENTSTPAATVVHDPPISMSEQHKHFFIGLTTYETIPSVDASDEVRAALATGYVVALVDAEQLVDDSLERMASRESVTVSVVGSKGGPFYRGGPEQTGLTVNRTAELNVGGQPWYLTFSAPLNYELTPREQIAPLFFVAGGFVFTFLVLALYFSRAGINLRLIKR